MSTYLDASFVVSLYSPDGNYANAANVVLTAQPPLIVSEWCELEAVNSFRLRVFRKDATASEAQRSQRELQLDLEKGILQRSPMPDSFFLRAHHLSEQYTEQLGTRGAHIIHVAAALELEATAFYSFDVQQRKLAAAVGLNVNPL